MEMDPWWNIRFCERHGVLCQRYEPGLVCANEDFALWADRNLQREPLSPLKVKPVFDAVGANLNFAIHRALTDVDVGVVDRHHFAWARRVRNKLLEVHVRSAAMSPSDVRFAHPEDPSSIL
jgi:hypothetical protein